MAAAEVVEAVEAVEAEVEVVEVVEAAAASRAHCTERDKCPPCTRLTCVAVTDIGACRIRYATTT